MPNEITIVVKGDNRSEPAFKQPQDDLDKLKAKAKATGIDLDGLAHEFDQVSRRTDYFGAELERTTGFSDLLDRKLLDLQGETRKLGEEFNRTGDVDLLKRMFSNERAEGELAKLKDRITNALSDTGIKAGDAFKGGFVSGIGDLATAAAPILAPAAVALAAEITAAFGGATLGAVGAGGLVAGLIAQLHDPAVKAAADDLLHSLGAEFQNATSMFAKPLEQAFGILKTDLAGPIHDLGGAFADLAPFIDEFATYLGAAAQQLMPGFTRALEASGPVLGMLGRELPTIAHAFDIFFDEISKGSKGGGEALDTLIKAASLGIAGLGFAIRYASDIWDFFIRRLDDATGILAHLPGPFKELHNYVDGIAHSMDQGKDDASLFGDSLSHTGSAADGLTTAVRRLASEFDDLFGKQMGVDQANLKFQGDLLGLKLALDQHSTSLSLNSAAGVHNREVVLGLIQDAKNARDAMIAQAGGANASKAAIDQANAAYETAIGRIEKMGTQAGLSKKDLDALAGEYDINIVTHTEHFGADYQDYRAGERSGKASGGIMGAASGGMRDGLTWVGEYGRELVRLPSGSQVYPHGTSENMAGAAGSGGQQRIAIEMHFTGNTDGAIANWITKASREGLLQIYGKSVFGPTQPY